jgi:hypothetical protein
MKEKATKYSPRIVLVTIAFGIWTIVLQNAGVIPTNNNVNVVNSVDVNGHVNADVSGSVSVDNTVDINIKEILGRSAGAQESYTIDGKKYYSLDVSPR